MVMQIAGINPYVGIYSGNDIQGPQSAESYANSAVEKALSDMKQDQELQQYLYFVGDAQGSVRAVGESSGSNVRPMEDFSL